jgi:hypothetical protein
MKLHIREKANGVTIECRVTPRASRNALKGVREGVLLVALNAPPVEGRANEALIAFLADLMGVPKSHISLMGGEHRRNKVVFIDGLSPQQAASILEKHADEDCKTT